VLALLAGACGPGSDSGDGTDAAGPTDARARAATGGSGAGGMSGSGGARGTGGSGSGGTTGGGGARGTGGMNGTGSGGMNGTGSGGARGTGGANGSGDAGPDAGGSPDSGGTGDGGTGDGGSGDTGVVAAGVRWFGRVDLTNDQRPRFSWSGTGFVARFQGTSLALQINSSGAFIFKTVVDGAAKPAFTIPAGSQTATLATGLAAGTHTVELYRQTEGSQGDSQFLGLTVGGGTLMAPPTAPARFIEIIGDSITCGYGTLGAVSDSECFSTESHWDSYGAVMARALGADLSTIAVSGQGAYRNYGGDMTNTLPMIYTRALTNDATPAWDFRTQPQVVIINLGTNDISNGKGDPGTPFRTAYTGLVQTVRSKYLAALIICTNGPLLSGTDLTTILGHIKAVVDARKAAGDTNIEAFDQIATQTSDKAACQYHPNPAENQLMANQLVAEIKARLGW